MRASKVVEDADSKVDQLRRQMVIENAAMDARVRRDARRLKDREDELSIALAEVGVAKEALAKEKAATSRMSVQLNEAQESLKASRLAQSQVDILQEQLRETSEKSAKASEKSRQREEQLQKSLDEARGAGKVASQLFKTCAHR